jgi:hypothetical protein
VVTITTTRAVGWCHHGVRLWIPAGVAHVVHMGGPTTTRSAYVLPDGGSQGRAAGALHRHQRFALLHALLSEAMDLPAEYVLGSRDDHLMHLLIDEIATMPSLPLNTPLPQDPRMARCAER